MAKLSAEISLPILENLPSRSDEVPEARALSPMPDHTAMLVGHIMVSWGQTTHTMLRYTRALIAYNGGDPILQKAPEFKRIKTRFKVEAEKAFTASPNASCLAADCLIRLDKAKQVRDCLAHETIHWGLEGSEPVIIVKIPRTLGRTQTHIIRLNRLESLRLDVEIAHGRLHQLALGTVHPPPYTSAEKELLQAIVAKGFQTHPI